MILDKEVVGTIDQGVSHWIGHPPENYESIDCPPEIEVRLKDNNNSLQFNYLEYKDGKVTIPRSIPIPKDIIKIG